MPVPTSPEQIVALNQAALDSAFALLNTSLNGVEKAVSLNLSTARSALRDQFETTSELLATRNLPDAYALQSAQAQPQLEKLQSYSRGIYEIAAETQEALVNLFEARHAELNKSLSSLLDWYGKSSANSGLAIAAVKSAITAANSAYANANQTARQVAEITGAGVNAATSATTRAIGASASPSRKKAA